MDFKKILFPTDFSESSKFALPFAVSMATKFQAHLTLVHVIEPIVTPVDFAWGTYNYPDIEKQVNSYAEDSLKKIVDESVPGEIETDVVILYGKPWREVVTYAKENAMDLIVIPTHGLSGLSHAIYGSTAEKVIRKAPCPVLTIRHPDVKFDMP